MTDYLVDVDGTTLDLSHRLHWIQTKPKNYEAFFAACKHDTPIKQVIEVVQSILDAGHKVIFCSGRPEKTREDTVVSLLNAFNGNLWREDLKLYMRKDGDYRPDYVVKKELLQKIREDGFAPSVVFDDRKNVVKMWREEKLFVFDVNQTPERDF